MTTLIETESRSIEVSKPDKTLFPESGITKEELARYYARIGETMLPHVRDRAMTLHRFPDGIDAEGFIQKDAPDYFPDWIERHPLPKEDGEVDYVVANDVATLVYLADQGCITPHVTLSRVDKPDRPDRMVFDIDPPEELDDLHLLHHAVRMVGEVIDGMGVDMFLMTTGSKGYHIVVPLDRSDDFDTIRHQAKAVADRVVEENPDLLTVAQRKAKREGRVFVDYLRNSYGQTTVAPYAVRALERRPVATPLDWDELGSSEPGKYTIENIFRRLSQKEDPWLRLTRS
jgi:bifunctional non-homologous end joining protein LigD